jgi:hypothetical protein
MARNLILLRCGQKSLHRKWLDTGRRNWDIILCPYQDIDAGDLQSHLVVGQKWSGLHRFLTDFSGWRDYDYICLPDDDILADAATWSAFFKRCNDYKVSLAAPALTKDSYFTFPITLENTEFLARSVTFVEIMNPCFSRSFLERALPTFALSRSGTGFGLDYLWAFMLSYKNMWIIDETPVCHTRPIGSAREQITASLAKYDLEFIKGFNIPFDAYTIGGIDKDGQSMDAAEPDFDVRLRRGYSYLEQRHPALWQKGVVNPSKAPPDIDQDKSDRIELSFARFRAPDQTISRGRPACISSVSQWSWSGDPTLEATGGNDGRLNGSCGFHTDFETNPWWQVDLESICGITSILIYNRINFKSRCIDFDILSSLDNRSWTMACSKRDGRTFGGLDGFPFSATFDPPLRGRFVRVQLAGNNFLHLDQVEIFGTRAEENGHPSPMRNMPNSGDLPERPGALSAESVIMLERILADSRGRFLLKQAVEEFTRGQNIDSSSLESVGVSHMRNDGASASRGQRLPRESGLPQTLSEAMKPQPGGVIDELVRELYDDDTPFTHADARYIDKGYPHTNLIPDVVASVLDIVRPHFWLELGSMLGGSAIRVAEIVKRKQIDTEIVCIDPFTGDVNMWAWEQPYKKAEKWQFLRLERGRPSIYDRFLANVAAAGHHDIILPIAATSIVGIKLLRRLLEEARISSLPSVIYLDSAHEPDETLLELQNCWAVLGSGGILMGDDWGWPAVRNDVLRFVKTIDVNREQTQRLVARSQNFTEQDGVLLDRGQWLIAK